MNDNNDQINKQAPKIALIALFLGISSILLFVVAVIIGFLVESIGIVSLLGVVSGFALAAIICAIIAINKIAAAKLSGKQVALTGLILGAITLLLTVFLRVAVFLFFIPWLGA